MRTTARRSPIRLSAIVDKNGNMLSFTYEQRKSNNKPMKFLKYVTAAAGRPCWRSSGATFGRHTTQLPRICCVQSTNTYSPDHRRPARPHRYALLAPTTMRRKRTLDQDDLTSEPGVPAAAPLDQADPIEDWEADSTIGCAGGRSGELE